MAKYKLQLNLNDGTIVKTTNSIEIPSVSANPSTTSATLTGITIDGTSYAINGSSIYRHRFYNSNDYTIAELHIINNDPNGIATMSALNINTLYKLTNTISVFIYFPASAIRYPILDMSQSGTDTIVMRYLDGTTITTASRTVGSGKNWNSQSTYKL